MLHYRGTRRVVFQPGVYQAMQRGINQLVDAIRPTLGPCPRLVAVDPISGDGTPELLDSGSSIARRFIQLANVDEDVGAMYIREVLCQVHDQVGDGTATAAVLFGEVYNQSIRYLAAGGNAVRLQHYLQQGGSLILDEQTRLSSAVKGEQMLARLAESICHDRELACLLGEIFDVIGQYGRLEIRDSHSRETTREYVEGMYWEKGVVSRAMITDPQKLRTEFEDAAILISDLEITQPEQIFPVLELALTKGVRRLLLVVGKMSESAIGFLLANKAPERFQLVAVTTPGWDNEEQAAALEDLSILTGGNPFLKSAGDTFTRICPDDFGHARRIWADHQNFGIVGGKGNPRRLRQHIASLRNIHSQVDDSVRQAGILKRIGKLMGGSATLWVGGTTELELKRRVALARQTAAAMREAIGEGVVPGGGVALLACKPALQERLQNSQDADEQAAYRVLLKAIESPMRTIVTNAGHDPGDVMAMVRLSGNGNGFDAASGQVVDVVQAGIFDPTSVLKAAVYAGVFSAALALTVDVLVHRRQQDSHAPIRTPGKRKRL